MTNHEKEKTPREDGSAAALRAAKLLQDPVCEHGTALDVHCCNCHSGFLFDIDSCVCDFTEKPMSLPAHSIHRCKVCGCLWRQWADDGSWSVIDAQNMGKCCDNVAMGEQIEQIYPQADLARAQATNTRLERDTRVDDAEQTIVRLQRYIATFPARPWLETDHPDVVACMGSAPACAGSGCQLHAAEAREAALIAALREIAEQPDSPFIFDAEGMIGEHPPQRAPKLIALDALALLPPAAAPTERRE